MNAAQLTAPDHPGPSPSQLNLTLDPIRIEGPDALAPDPPDDIVSAKLTRLDLIWENVFHEVTTRTADDLFACPDGDGSADDPVPEGAEPIRATLEIQFKDDPAPHAVDITPPHTLTLQHQGDAPRIIPFLSKRHFTITAKLANVLVLLLALAGALVPDLDDDDDDDPDDNHHTDHSPTSAFSL